MRQISHYHLFNIMAHLCPLKSVNDLKAKAIIIIYTLASFDGIRTDHFYKEFNVGNFLNPCRVNVCT